jgi:tRNA threonylcarbamoyladenosine biosynthesis protein TsaB
MTRQPNILCIETSGGNGSVALQSAQQVFRSEIRTPRSQTEKLLSHVDRLLGDAGIDLRRLDAISFGCGPGSFIGVRLAGAVAQGLAVAARVGLAPVSSMAALAGQVMLNAASGTIASRRALVCLDARMGEVYWADYSRESDGGIPSTSAERLLRPEDVAWPAGSPGAAVGSGFAEYPALAAAALERGYRVAPSEQPRAEDLLPFARAALESAQLIAPERWRIEYLRDETAWRALEH